MEMYEIDEQVSPVTGLCLNDIVEIFDLFKQFGEYPNACLSSLQIWGYGDNLQKDSFGREVKGTVVFDRYIADESIRTGLSIGAILSLSYRLASPNETHFDTEGHYKIYSKSGIRFLHGRFILVSGKLFEGNSDRILGVHAFLKTLAFDTATLETWAISEREMFVTCSNHKCRKYRMSKIFNTEDVVLFSNKFSNIENLKGTMRCSVCSQTHPELTLFPIRNDGIIVHS